MKGIKVIFFDAYGTFLDTGTGSVDAARKILEKNRRTDIDPVAFYARWKQLHRQGMRTGCFAPERDIFVADLEELYKEYSVSGEPAEDVKIMLDSLLDRRVFQETACVMDMLKTRYRLMVASNTDTQPLMQNLRLNALSFDRIFTSESLGCYKPASSFYEAILESAEVRPEEAFFVGDSPEEDVAAPTGMGMAAILVDRRNSGGGYGEYRRIPDLYGLLDIFM